MKKIFFTATFALFGSILFGQSQRLVLLEEFTQASCGPCAAANPGFNTLLAANTAKAVSVKNQTSWPGVDPMNAQNPSEVARRVSYYSVSGVPDAFQDGVNYSSPSSVTQASIDAEYAVPSPFTIQLTHWFNSANDSIYINCTMTCTQNITMATPVVQVAMIEKSITFATPPGSNGETQFSNVMRKMYPDARGTSLMTTWVVGQKKTVSFKAKIPTYIYDKTQIGVVSWIQDNGTKNVKQAGFSSAAGTPSALPPIADFTADVTTSCDGIISFSDQSALFPTSWMWNFGDGDSSVVRNPVHKYNTSGTFTVKLTAKNANGNNLLTKTAYVTVTLSGAAPSGVNATRCGPGIVNLSATPAGTGTLNWYNAAGALVNTGTTYSVNLTAGTMKFSVAEMTPNVVTNTGRIDSALGGGGFFTANTIHGLYFDVLQPCTLVSVKTYASTAGNRTIEVQDPSGAVVQSAVVNIPVGMSTVNLNFPLGAGTGFFIKIATGSTVGLYRNNANASYPYTSSVVNITGNDAGPAFYYFFYDWKVRKNACGSLGTIVKGIDSCYFVGIREASIANSLSVYPNPSTGSFSVSCQMENVGDYTMKITNMLGQVVNEETLNHFSGQYSRQIDLSKNGKGMYLLIISNGKSEDVRKLIVY